MSVTPEVEQGEDNKDGRKKGGNRVSVRPTRVLMLEFNQHCRKAGPISSRGKKENYICQPHQILGAIYRSKEGRSFAISRKPSEFHPLLNGTINCFGFIAPSKRLLDEEGLGCGRAILGTERTPRGERKPRWVIASEKRGGSGSDRRWGK